MSTRVYMSTEYKYPAQVPTEVLSDRLHQLALAAAEGDRGEFTMRVPVEFDRDADMVLEEASRRMRATLTAFDLHEHLHRQREFSERTFGPGERLAGVIDHIRKELAEVEKAAADGEPTLPEWVDVIILALDGAWRSGATPQEISAAIAAKQARNEARMWPDWRSADPDTVTPTVSRQRFAGRTSRRCPDRTFRTPRRTGDRLPTGCPRFAEDGARIFGLLAMKEAHYAFAERYQRPIESAPESVREAFEAAWVMSRAVAIADSARVCKTWKEVCQSARRHGAACGADECMKLVAIQDED